MTIAEKCALTRHYDCDGCGCPCHTQAAQFADAVAYGGRYKVPPTASRDLVAHLQSGRERLPLEQAVRVAYIVLDLGWRPSAPAGDAVPIPPEVATVDVQEALL